MDPCSRHPIGDVELPPAKVCSMNENVSKRRVVPKAPPHAVSTRSSPRCQSPTHSRMRDESSYSPQTVVSSNPSRSFERRCYHRSERNCAKMARLIENIRKRTFGRNCAQMAQLSRHPHGPSRGRVPVVPKERNRAKTARLIENVRRRTSVLKRSLKLCQ